METAAPFSTWAIVEIMGHQTYAGHISEETIAGQAFLRIDIPATDEQEPFTKLFSPSAVYGITPTTEAIARAMAQQYEKRPIGLYDLPPEWREKIQSRGLPNHVEVDADIYLDDAAVFGYDDGGDVPL